MIKILLSGILLFAFTFFSYSQERADEWLEWGVNYDDLGFATGHSHAMIATDFDLEGEVRYLKAIEYNSQTPFGVPDTVPVNWRIVEFDGEPLWDNQIGTLTGNFVVPGTGTPPVYTEVEDNTPITGHFAIALSFADSMYHVFIMDESAVSNHTWFWKQSIGWVLAQSVIFVPGAYHLRLLVSDNPVGTEENFLSLEQESLQAYPNPFMDKISISFSNHTAGHIKLDVLNSYGIPIEKLCDAWLPEGNHNFHFSGADLSSGIYLIRLTTDSGVISRKVLRK
ncbi:MAG: T9SS type A sorting domain-containing protein [Bacteroidetes bacterium]|nr:T9SS type A sorting domain-containing protein [Bacteroidota bacterium]MCK5765533.1 T9SS type A sorting domain-containing protein [Bacteroidales bacterium]